MVVLGLVRLGEAEGPGQEARDLVIESFLTFRERSEIDPFAIRHDLQAFPAEKDVEPGDVRVRVALAHDEKPRPAVRRELDLQSGFGGHRLHALSLIHISEPTRLGMISYAVFCLKKK